MNKAIDEVVKSIIESEEYQKCLELKNKMEKNQEIKEKVEQIKHLQKQYVKSKDETIKKQLESLEEELNCKPIYVVYNEYLEKVNGKIDFVRDYLNDYFDKVVNEKE